LDVVAGSNKSAWWQCLVEPTHVWNCSIQERTGNHHTTCPYCLNRKVGIKNSLLATNPELASEWHLTNNIITPNDITRGSSQKVWWICSEGHEWRASPGNRTCQKQGCPICNPISVSKIEKRWLTSLGILEKNWQYNIPGTRYRADAYDPNTNTIYEFDGDFFHGNPAVYDSEDINYINKLKFGELYMRTLNRREEIKKLGYKLIYIWEFDFRKQENKGDNYASL